MNDDELQDAARGAFESAMAFGVNLHAFERLARTVRDAERDACAKVCRDNEAAVPDDGSKFSEGRRVQAQRDASSIVCRAAL